MPQTKTHAETTTYIREVADALAKADITVTDIHIDTPEQAARCGREYGRIGLSHPRIFGSLDLTWADWRGWTTLTHAHGYALLEGQTRPEPQDVATAAASHLHEIAHGGYDLTPLP